MAGKAKKCARGALSLGEGGSGVRDPSFQKRSPGGEF